MATDNEPQGRNFWKAIGSLTANVKWLIEATKRLEQRLDDTNDRLDRGLKETNDRIERGQAENIDRLDQGLKNTNARIDRVIFAIISIGGTIIAIGGTIIGLLIIQIVSD